MAKRNPFRSAVFSMACGFFSPSPSFWPWSYSTLLLSEWATTGRCCRSLREIYLTLDLQDSEYCPLRRRDHRNRPAAADRRCGAQRTLGALVVSRLRVGGRLFRVIHELLVVRFSAWNPRARQFTASGHAPNYFSSSDSRSRSRPGLCRLQYVLTGRQRSRSGCSWFHRRPPRRSRLAAVWLRHWSNSHAVLLGCFTGVAAIRL